MDQNRQPDQNRPQRPAQARPQRMPGQPPRTPGRPPQGAAQPRRQPPRRRPTRRQIIRNRILFALAVLAVLGLFIGGAVWFLTRDTGPTEPEPFDAGPAAAAWEKNANGIYFSSDGTPIPAAVKKGIDVSHHQGEIDWAKAQAAGIDFAILRCGVGSEWSGQGDIANYNQDDRFWRYNADECTRLGIPFGAYLYSYATTEEQARLEADHVARLLGLVAPPHEGLEDYTASPYRLQYPVYYDLEYDAGYGELHQLFPEEAAHLVAVFFEQLESHGYNGEEGLYVSLNWARGRLQDPGFDPWRSNLWLARWSATLDYRGPYRMWQASCTEPGEKYGASSDNIDIDFVMEPLTFTGIGETKTKGDAAPVLSNDTYGDQLWLAQKNDRAALLTNEPSEEDGGQRVFFTTSDSAVATVDRHGTVRARGPGSCTVTATRADGRLSAACTVRVGDVTVPVFATGALHGNLNGDGVTLADVAALAAGPDAILLDAGGSLQGHGVTSLTGGMDMASAFAAAGYDLQAVAGQDLAFGVARLLLNAQSATGPMLAANLRTPEGVALFYRGNSWNRNRITNGMHYLLQRAGHKIGFFAMVEPGADFARYAVTNETAPLAADAAQTANEQVAALRAEGAEAIVCILAPAAAPVDHQALQTALKGLGVDAVIDGSLAVPDAVQGALPTVPAATGLDYVSRLDLTFTADGAVTAAVSSVSAATLQAARSEERSAAAADAYQSAMTGLDRLAAGDAELENAALFTLEQPTGSTRRISFANYVAELYETRARDDAANWGIDAATPLCAVAGAVQELQPGTVSNGALLQALPVGERLQLVQTTADAFTHLLAGGIVTQTYLAAMTEPDFASAESPVALITDTATLRTLSDQDYTVLRDYGDAYWVVRMAINDATGGFANAFQLPEAPQKGAGRGN